MNYQYNNLELKHFRRKLRNNQTDCEALLWSVLRNKQCNGYKFFRQYSVGKYILDFFCPKLRLAIELDGSQHSERDAILYDKDRNDYLDAVYIKVLRFWNMEITKNIKGSIDKILQEILKVADPLLK